MLNGDGSENGKKKLTGILTKKTILYVQHTFSYMYLPLLLQHETS